ncbi:recombinase family protein [Paenibacillus aestuarii]|uniref:Uncharacterized protein n=1 Tax=Paenibacillus aestuarii TaxID=516965 RepID=A0ABW0K2F1_9BACL|nr:hypothetical protein [Paenibacillus aestuarii]
MWNTISISDHLYGFQLEQGYLDPWAAVGHITTMKRELVILVDLFLSEIETCEQYDGLLEAIRRFVRYKAEALGFSMFEVRFHCNGLLDEAIDLPLPKVPHPSGRFAVDHEFVEKEKVIQIGHAI